MKLGLWLSVLLRLLIMKSAVLSSFFLMKNQVSSYFMEMNTRVQVEQPSY